MSKLGKTNMYFCFSVKGTHPREREFIQAAFTQAIVAYNFWIGLLARLPIEN